MTETIGRRGSPAIQLAIGTVALAVAPAIAGVLAARSLGPDGRGELAVALAVATIAGSVGMRGYDVAIMSVPRRDLDEGSAIALIGRRARQALVVEGPVAAVVAAMVLWRLPFVLLVSVVAMSSLSSGYLLLRALNIRAARGRRVLLTDCTAAAVTLCGAVVAADRGAEAGVYVFAACRGVGSWVFCRSFRPEHARQSRHGTTRRARLRSACRTGLAGTGLPDRCVPSRSCGTGGGRWRCDGRRVRSGASDCRDDDHRAAPHGADRQRSDCRCRRRSTLGLVRHRATCDLVVCRAGDRGHRRSAATDRPGVRAGIREWDRGAPHPGIGQRRFADVEDGRGGAVRATSAEPCRGGHPGCSSHHSRGNRSTGRDRTGGGVRGFASRLQCSTGSRGGVVEIGASCLRCRG